MAKGEVEDWKVMNEATNDMLKRLSGKRVDWI
ncbi:hypothetical protein ACT7DF_18635 [Bacillus cereus]